MSALLKVMELINMGEFTMRSRGQKKDDLITLLRGERGKVVGLFQSKGMSVKSRFRGVHVEDYGADPSAHGAQGPGNHDT